MDEMDLRHLVSRSEETPPSPGFREEPAQKQVCPWVARCMEWGYWPVVLMLGAVAVSFPTVTAGLLNDDYCQRAALIGPSPFLDRLSGTGLAPEDSGRLSTALFDQFVAVHPQMNLAQLKAYGALPWWTCNDLRVAFWRPAASFTHWLDHRLFPNSLKLMHVHNILWFAAAMLVVSVLYGRLMTVRWMAGLAALMYLLADFTYFPTMWLANRNILMALFFGVLTLIFYDGYRRRGGRAGLVAACGCLLLSLLSAEAGIGTFAYLLAYEVALARERWTGRLRALAPFVVVIVLWRVLYNVLGYGASGGGFYFDPVREPIRYGAAVLARAPFLVAGQWTTVPPELYSMLPSVLKGILWVLLLTVTVMVPIAVWPLLRANRRARFWLTGMYGAVLPVCATVPMSRVLVFVAIGAFGLIAELVGGWQRRELWVPRSGRRRSVLLVLVIAALAAHLPWAAVRRLTAPRVMAKLERRITKPMVAGLRLPLRNRDLVIVNAPSPAVFLYDTFRIAYESQSLPAGIRALVPAFGPVEIVRTDPDRLVVRAVSRSLLDCAQGKRMHFVFFYRALSDVRGPGQPLQAGQRIVLPRMTVEVMQVDERGFPVEVAFRFAVPLEDTSLKWLFWDWRRRGYQLFTVPAPGERVTLGGPF